MVKIGAKKINHKYLETDQVLSWARQSLSLLLGLLFFS
jgi:hypothetical protein